MARASSRGRLNAPSTAMRYRAAMVDILALVLSHGLLALAAWRLVLRSDVDADPAVDGDMLPPEPPVPSSAARPPAARSSAAGQRAARSRS